MTPERAKELLPVIQAYANGKTIQYETAPMKWHDILPGCKKHPLSFFPECNYRIKPEKKTGWINIYKGGRCGGVFISVEEASCHAGLAVEIVACIQITYEEGEGLNGMFDVEMT